MRKRYALCWTYASLPHLLFQRQAFCLFVVCLSVPDPSIGYRNSVLVHHDFEYRGAVPGHEQWNMTKLGPDLQNKSLTGRMWFKGLFLFLFCLFFLPLDITMVTAISVTPPDWRGSPLGEVGRAGRQTWVFDDIYELWCKTALTSW